MRTQTTTQADDNDTLPDSFFRHLNAKEVGEFLQWARDNHQPGQQISGCWHPIVRAECERIDSEPAPYLHNHKW
jgi:hypothetical protein